jgi:hypothetical protein
MHPLIITKSCSPQACADRFIYTENSPCPVKFIHMKIQEEPKEINLLDVAGYTRTKTIT